MQGEYGKSLLRRRGELVERSFAHCYETGGMRRCYLRGRENILKRQLAHVSAFNLSLVMRKLLGAGTPRGWKERAVKSILRVFLCFNSLHLSDSAEHLCTALAAAAFSPARPIKPHPRSCRNQAYCTTGC